MITQLYAFIIIYVFSGSKTELEELADEVASDVSDEVSETEEEVQKK